MQWAHHGTHHSVLPVRKRTSVSGNGTLFPNLWVWVWPPGRRWNHVSGNGTLFPILWVWVWSPGRKQNSVSRNGTLFPFLWVPHYLPYCLAAAFAAASTLAFSASATTAFAPALPVPTYPHSLPGSSLSQSSSGMKILTPPSFGLSL